jgi:hypothetical protein
MSDVASAFRQDWPGMLTPGNVDINARPVVRLPDGSIATVRSRSFNFGNGETLLPTVSDDGRLLSDDEAVALFKQSGRHLGVFDTPDNADVYGRSLSDRQGQFYRGR